MVFSKAYGARSSSIIKLNDGKVLYVQSIVLFSLSLPPALAARNEICYGNRDPQIQSVDILPTICCDCVSRETVGMLPFRSVVPGYKLLMKMARAPVEMTSAHQVLAGSEQVPCSCLLVEGGKL